MKKTQKTELEKQFNVNSIFNQSTYGFENIKLYSIDEWIETLQIKDSTALVLNEFTIIIVTNGILNINAL